MDYAECGGETEMCNCAVCERIELIKKGRNPFLYGNSERAM